MSGKKGISSAPRIEWESARAYLAVRANDAADGASGDVLEENRKMLGSLLHPCHEPKPSQLSSFRRSLLYDSPRYNTMLGWSRSLSNSISALRLCTMPLVLASSLSCWLLGSSTCLTAIVSPVLTLKPM